MEFIINLVLLTVGFIMLVKGADWFVDSAAGIAGKLGIPELVIGLTIVAFGTSAPELSVSLSSAIKMHSGGIAIGNIVGSNIMNIVLILGITSLICKIPCKKNSLSLDIPYMLGSTVVFIILGYFGNSFSHTDGFILTSLLIVYIIILLVISIKTKTNLFLEEENEEDSKNVSAFRIKFNKIKNSCIFMIVLLVIGLFLIIYGSDFVIKSATNIAKVFGVSDRIIGLTMIAFGTSLPELITSITAAKKEKLILL